MLPDLAARVAYWQEKLRIRDWRIEAVYVDELRTKDGAEAYALVHTFPDDAAAYMRVRIPRTAEEAAKLEEKIVHELLHVLLAPLAGHNVEPASIHAEERAVWTLAPLLAAGGREADMLARAMRAPRYARVAARAQRAAAVAARRYRMDPKKLADLALKAGQLSAQEGLPEEVAALLKEFVAAMAGGGGETEAAPESGQMAMTDEEKDKPPMGMTEQKDPMYQRQPQRAAEQDLDAKIERLIDARVRAALQPVAGKIDATAAAVEAQQRDQLLAVHGHKLPEGQLRWARTQTLKVVQGLLGATPDAEAPAGQQRAARAVQGAKDEGAELGGPANTPEAMLVDRAMRQADETLIPLAVDRDTGTVRMSNVAHARQQQRAQRAVKGG